MNFLKKLIELYTSTLYTNTSKWVNFTVGK